MQGDSDLLAAARAGDLDAFAALVRRHESRVRAVLSRLLDDTRDVEEATQDTFVQAWRSLGRFRGDSAIFTWLYRIAVNEALQRRRRQRAETVELDATQPAGERVGPMPEAEAAETRRFLLGRLRALPFEYRAPLVLRDLEGLSNREAAAVLGISVAALKSRVHRARMQLRAEIEAWETGRGERGQ